MDKIHAIFMRIYITFLCLIITFGIALAVLAALRMFRE